MACNCPMRDGEKLSGEFPGEASAVKQYGPNLRAFAVNLLTQGYVSIDRTRQILEGLGIPVSTGTLQNFLDSCAVETESAADEIRRKVAALDVIHCDETGVDLNGKLHWMHCLATANGATAPSTKSAAALLWTRSASFLHFLPLRTWGLNRYFHFSFGNAAPFV